MVSLYSYKNIFLRYLAYFIDFIIYILSKIINQFFKNCDKNNFFIKDKIINLLIFKNDNLGDVYLFLPFFENMKKGLEQNGKYDDILIDISINPNSLPLVQNNPYINNVFISPYFRKRKKDNKFFKKNNDSIKVLKKKHLYKYHIIIDITGQFLTALFCFNPFRQKKQYIFGFFNGEIGRFMYNKFINNNMLNYVHEIENFKIVLQHFGISCSSWNPKVYYPSEYKVKNIPDKDFIICHIGSGFEYKLWPLEKWSSLLNKILKSSKVFDIIIIGDESEKNICSSIIKDISTIYKMRIKNMVGKTNFLESYSLVNSAYLFIGNDSVFSHVAASKNIPSIQIMNGANSKDRWGIEYFGSHAKVVVGLDENHNCQLKNCKYPCLHMKKIGVDNIFRLYNELIK